MDQNVTEIFKQLHEVEIAYFKGVCNSPGMKYPMLGLVTSYEDENGVWIEGWQKLEELGLIKAVGSYKWIPIITYNELLLKMRIEELEAEVALHKKRESVCRNIFGISKEDLDMVVKMQKR